MHERLPPREISEIINFPNNPAYQFDNVRFHSKLNEQAEKKRKKYKIIQKKMIQYKIGDKALLKNRELPSSKEGIAKKLLLLYNGPYIIVKNNNNNTYVISDVETKKIKGTYNQVSLKMYYKPNKQS